MSELDLRDPFWLTKEALKKIKRISNEYSVSIFFPLQYLALTQIRIHSSMHSVLIPIPIPIFAAAQNGLTSYGFFTLFSACSLITEYFLPRMLQMITLMKVGSFPRFLGSLFYEIFLRQNPEFWQNCHCRRCKENHTDSDDSAKSETMT
ncbi:hypothetical protein TSMEX_000322 [Taenia solium]|eukprot:TsM_000615300 transcript=TsM_000615300 gene=TsM_000615300